MPTSTTKTMPYTWVHEASSRGQFFRNLAYAPRFNEKQRPRTSMMSCQPKRRCVACVAHWPIPAPPRHLLATQKVRQDGRHVTEVRVPAVEAADVGLYDCDAVGVADRA